MNEDAMNGHRVVAWMDGLTDEERVHVQRLSELPPNMQVGYVWVDFNRQMDDLRDEHRQSAEEARQALEEARQAARTTAIVKNVASGAGGGVLVALAYLGHAMGLDKVIR